ncbi:hypothetical protein ZIOFF_054331 [Zingiber officinale]|uniref:chitinase n=1 Tax=Zingiber officinale TaxID=94328 RepID=A0A8J5KMF3_ZINOF|nr:hypothetical protein ZIOFF_054331 [Zingiber officinale]
MALHESNQTLLLVVRLFFAGMEVAAAQNCGCSANLCCSRFGYCGTSGSDDYCGTGCQQGPCYSSRGSVADIVTQSFFDGIINQSDSSCAGRRFYSRDAFLTAAGYYPGFGRTGSSEDARREIAAFYAHVTDVTDHLCFIEATNRQSQCDTNRTDWPCVSGRDNYGRGPLQLTWNYNYGPAGLANGFDGLRAPETVANDVVISFRTALWFWMNYCHNLITSGQGFGATIRAVNGACDDGNRAAFNARIGYYRDYCSRFGVDPGNNLTC